MPKKLNFSFFRVLRLNFRPPNSLERILSRQDQGSADRMIRRDQLRPIGPKFRGPGQFRTSIFLVFTCVSYNQ